tara:strand:- start:1472 stop:1831 length:360 start_codon:yes stop_codon:yes gene_type:complete
MFKCPYSDCCQVFTKDEIRKNLRPYFRNGICPTCGRSVDIDVSGFSPLVAVAKPEPEPESSPELPYDPDMVEEEVEEVIDWGSCTVAQLKEALTERGLSSSGKKADLLERLEFYFPAEE